MLIIRKFSIEDELIMNVKIIIKMQLFDYQQVIILVSDFNRKKYQICSLILLTA
jgi:hypothetical protein